MVQKVFLSPCINVTADKLTGKLCFNKLFVSSHLARLRGHKLVACFVSRMAAMTLVMNLPGMMEMSSLNKETNLKSCLGFFP